MFRMLLYTHFQLLPLKFKTAKVIKHLLFTSDVDIENWLKFLNELSLWFCNGSLSMVEVNFTSPSYGSPCACGIRPLIGIFLIWNYWIQVWHHLSHMSWYFSVLVGQLLEDSSAAISVLQLPLLYFWSLLYAVRDLLHRSLKRVRDSRSRFTNEIAFSIIQWSWHKIKIPGSPESKHWL